MIEMWNYVEFTQRANTVRNLFIIGFFTIPRVISIYSVAIESHFMATTEYILITVDACQPQPAR